MIAKAVKGKGFRGALEYDLKKGHGQLIFTNMAGQNPRQLAAEFGEIRKLKPNLNKAVLHVSLSAAIGEQLTNEQWKAIGQRYLDGMGLENNQFIMTRHSDTAHEHIHILANRIRLDGGVTSDSQDYKKQETVMRVVELEFGLQSVASSTQSERKAPKKEEIEQGIRTGQPSTRQVLQQLCDAAMLGCKTLSTYLERLEAAGVELIPVVQLAGAKISGLMYRLDGVLMKGSDLGKAYSPAGLSKKGITYEQNRDFPAVSRCIEFEECRKTGGADRDDEAKPASEHGGPGQDTAAVGTGLGSADGRDTADPGGDRAEITGAEREVQPPALGISPDLGEHDSASSGSREQPGAKPGADDMDTLRPGRVDRGDFRTARDYVLDLAGSIASGAEPAGPESRGRVPQASRDRSLEALQKQISALGVPGFEIGVRHAKTGQMLNRQWTVAELEQSTAWLKRMNATGNDIYVRPAGEHALVLLDDLKAETLKAMQGQGYAPAAVLETSPGNYQAWVKMSDKPLSAEIRLMASQELAHLFDADKNSAGSRHYGRLAGFTNQKPKHTRDGRQPYVLAHDCPGMLAPAGAAHVMRIEQALEEAAMAQERQQRLETLHSANSDHGSSGQYDPIHEYQRQAQRLMAKYGEGADFSRMDWMIAQDMAKSGRFTAQDVERAILACSPNVQSRKAGHIEDYARRTAEKAWSSPEVQQHRQTLGRQAQRGGSLDGPNMG